MKESIKSKINVIFRKLKEENGKGYLIEYSEMKKLVKLINKLKEVE